ncbi:hypothetical protein ACWT_5229 [Actinoplanes sp. SE50]|uniref:SCO6745 family protein n=1 Tax=unclassified Actinoplanes TaxID=2626549 RepID=UPI00023EBBFF|nr:MULTISPECIES: hypothetical protein [unclassified Actinoplanes]AEV86246.1 hypothetical protein ACPL_5359 [Actinoplanes sp. SE50/110]ATO84644.1 hypothetical protein ACWT_5229 [Actinoplanes sp. SE50]SLM02054.1 uncharacterized protein ACSP50_5292 [Actinoplanes sp. SE50/110]
MGTVTESPSRLAWRVTEPLHALVYFVPEAAAAYRRLGLDPMGGYFALRAAALGAAGPELVAATFYNFNPSVIGKVLPAAWDVASPQQMVETRLAIADAALTRGLGAETLAGPEIAEAADLARTAARHASTMPHGRPLFAAHAGLPWPTAPHLVLFHAQMLLREFRGDGHLAALLSAGISGLESVVLHVASGEIEERFLRGTRGWKREQWAAAADALRARGLLSPSAAPAAAAPDPASTPGAVAPSASASKAVSASAFAAASAAAAAGTGERTRDELSEAGRALRAEIEATTDRLAEPAYRILGDDGCRRLAELTRPLSRTLVKSGFLNPVALLG